MTVTPGTKESYIGAFLENIIYGFYVSTFVECCAILRRKQLQTLNVRKYLTATTVLMAILITTRCVIDTVRCIIALGESHFSRTRNAAEDAEQLHTVDNPGLEFGSPNTTIDIVTNTCLFLLTAVADAFVIFRTFIVWYKSWLVIALPSLLFLANLGISTWSIVGLIKFDPEDGSLFQNALFKTTIAFLSLTLCINIICTGLISFRIFHIQRRVLKLGTSRLSRLDAMKVIPIIVESASMYTLLLVGIIISLSFNSYVNYLLIDCTPPTIGLVFSYIIIRVSRGTAYGDSTDNEATGMGQTDNQTLEFNHSPNRFSRPGTDRIELDVREERVLSSTPDVLVFMGSRKLAAAEEALAKFAADIHPSSAVVPVQLDITDDGSVKAAHDFIAETLKAKGISGLDVLTNNAGTVGPGFKETYAVNVFGTVTVTTAMRSLMRDGGAILNITSLLGSIAVYTKKPGPPGPLYTAYGTSKTAVNALTVHWALEEQRNGSGIRVACIEPGFNATSMTQYNGMSPTDGCKIIVKTALEKDGRTAVFFNKDTDLEW
ncbi:hypothetical protein C8R44DRAFT_893167 [Mycena epipterygia]|nr:hypothetical protein C8R44DRAFT_893167 [Mycena epipterygia]